MPALVAPVFADDVLRLGRRVTSGDAFWVGVIVEEDHAHIGLQAYFAEFFP